MANGTEVSGLAALALADVATGDLVYAVDVSEATPANRGKKMTFDALFGLGVLGRLWTLSGTLSTGGAVVTLQVLAPTTGAGNSIVIDASDGVSANGNGGSITLQAGAAHGSGTAGSFIVKNSAGTTTLQVGRAGNDRIEAAASATGGFYAGAGTDTFSLNGSTFVVANNYQMTWRSTNSWFGGSTDTGLGRVAAGILNVTDGSTGTGWLKQGAGYKVTTADVTNSTATMANLTALTVSLAAGRTYAIELCLLLENSSAGDGVKVDFDGGTATATAFRVHGQIADASGVPMNDQVTALATDLDAASITGALCCWVRGFIVVNAAGTFIPRVAMNSVSLGTLTVYRGSWLKVDDIG